MKIAIYGATGTVGRHLVTEAVTRGHDVTALSRHEAPLPAGSAWQHGDLTDIEGVAAVAAGHDAVITANGPSRVPGEDPFAFAGVIRGVAGAVGGTASGTDGGTRLFVVGGAGSLTVDGARLVDSPDFPAEYKSEALASAEALAFLRTAGPELDWTYLSPAPVFPAGEATGSYVVGGDSPVGETISGDDFARAVLDELEAPAHRRARFTVAAPAA